MKRKRWTILWLLLFFPVGLYRMWRYKQFPMWVRIVVSTFWGLYLILFMTGFHDIQPTAKQTVAPVQTKEVPKKAEVTATPKKEEVKKEEPKKEVVKSAAPKQETKTPVAPPKSENDQLQDKIKGIVNDVRQDKKGLESIEVVDDAGRNDGTKLVTITIKADDNWSNDLIRVGIQDDTTKMLARITKEKKISSVMFLWMFDMQDQYGNDKEDVITKIVVDRDVMDKINYKNFLYSDLPNVASQYWEHPTLSK